MVFRGTAFGPLDEHAYPIPPLDYDIGLRIAEMERLGVDVQVLSLSPLLFQYGVPAAEAVPRARLLNDELAAVQRARPERFRALGTLPLQDPDASVEELERVMGTLGMAGVQVGANVWGRDLDGPDLVRVLERAEQLGAVVFIHPAIMQSYPGAVANMDRIGDFYLRNLIGNPLDTTIAIARLLFGGTLERLPRLKLYLAHGGGYAVFGMGRFAHAHGVRHETAAAQRDPRELLRNVYVDTIVHDPPTLRYVVEMLGAERVMMGSDYPTDMGPADPVGAIDAAGFDAQTRALVLGGNAARLFGIG